MDNNRLTRKILEWDKNLTINGDHTTWYSEILSICETNNLQNITDMSSVFNLHDIVEKLQKTMLNAQQSFLKSECDAMPKLRTFKTFKEFDKTPSHILKPLSFIQRKFMSKLRLGCLEIRIEAGRYARPRLPVEARLCQVCGGAGGGGDAQEVEDEFHFLFRCKAYEDARSTWLHRVKKPENFLTLPQNEMLSIVLN